MQSSTKELELFNHRFNSYITVTSYPAISWSKQSQTHNQFTPCIAIDLSHQIQHLTTIKNIHHFSIKPQDVTVLHGKTACDIAAQIWIECLDFAA